MILFAMIHGGNKYVHASVLSEFCYWINHNKGVKPEKCRSLIKGKVTVYIILSTLFTSLTVTYNIYWYFN